MKNTYIHNTRKGALATLAVAINHLPTPTPLTPLTLQGPRRLKATNQSRQNIVVQKPWESATCLHLPLLDSRQVRILVLCMVGIILAQKWSVKSLSWNHKYLYTKYDSVQSSWTFWCLAGNLGGDLFQAFSITVMFVSSSGHVAHGWNPENLSMTQ